MTEDKISSQAEIGPKETAAQLNNEDKDDFSFAEVREEVDGQMKKRKREQEQEIGTSKRRKEDTAEDETEEEEDEMGMVGEVTILQFFGHLLICGTSKGTLAVLDFSPAEFTSKKK